MSQDDLSSRENQRPPGRRSRSTWIGLEIAAGLAIAGIVAGVSLSTLGGGTEATGGTTPSASSAQTATAGATIAGGEVIGVSVTGASLHLCSAEGTIHSVNLGPGVTFSFENHLGEILHISRLNYQDRWVPTHSLPPGDTYDVNTTVGNVWMIAFASPICLTILSIQNSGHISVS
jgi:hypothetical protein